ncbi:MAG: hypothetical protein J5580_01590 [Clostridia bacterium]|nr:hypothetical protein [Clostridia bacterium]
MESMTFDDEVACFTRIAQTRYEISRMMCNHLLIDEINPSDGILNPYYGRTIPDCTAGIVVEFINDIIPYCIYSHYGSMLVNPHVSKGILELTSNFLTEEQKDVFVKDFKEKYGATIIQPCQATRTKGIVLQPVIYNLAKLPTEKTLQRKQGSIIPVTTILPAQQINTEQIYWQQIREQVDENLRAAGHPEMTFTDAKISKRKSMIIEIRPKLPDYLAAKMKDRNN